MAVLVVFSFIAGMVTILSPCILPVLPILLAGAVGRGREKPLGIVTGFVASFTFFTLALSAVVRRTGIPAEFLRYAAILLLALFGIFLVIPRAGQIFEVLASRFLPKRITPVKGQGFGSGLLVGLSLGLLWTPCVGPIMAAVITLAATRDVSLQAFLITAAYAAGTAVPMLVLMAGGRKVLDSAPWLKSRSEAIQRGFGLVILLVAFILFKGYDRTLEARLLSIFPDYGSKLTAVENHPLVKEALNRFKNRERLFAAGSSGDRASSPYPLAPDIVAGGEWFNSPPLHLRDLRGKVVLIDFWTYTCINCIRTLPVLRTWHERYAGDGLVIIGVHTPEFEFEKDPRNVTKAIRDFGLKYPVVQDNDYATWSAYQNEFWPAKYFIDKDGRLRYSHFGEGGEKESEEEIRRLLEEAGRTLPRFPAIAGYSIDTLTPETYLGLGRTEHFGSPEKLRPGEAVYSLPSSLKPNHYAYQGVWTVTAEHSTPGPGSRLEFRFFSKNVFLVMRPEGNGAAGVKVLLDGKPVGAAAQGKDVRESTVRIESDRLYHLVSLDEARDHTLTLEFPSGGVSLFAFTFG